MMCIIYYFIRSTPLSPPNNIRGGNVHPSVDMYVRPYVRQSTKCFSDFNDIWYVDRSWWVMCDGMPHDPIQGQGHGASEVPKVHFSKSISSAIYSGSWQLTTDS